MIEPGNIFTRWTVLCLAEKGSFWHTAYSCVCDCGTMRIVEGTSLTSGNSKSCGCLCRDRSRTRLRKRPYGVLYNRLLYTGELTERDVSISYEEFLRFVEIKSCEYCGQTIIWKEFAQHKRSGGAYNLDRKDNSLDYTIENCVVCCGDCNLMKGDRFTYDEFKRIGRLVKQMRAEKGDSNDNRI